jgi:hypothetical protein
MQTHFQKTILNNPYSKETTNTLPKKITSKFNHSRKKFRSRTNKLAGYSKIHFRKVCPFQVELIIFTQNSI